MAANLMERLVGPPGFLGADDGGASPRTAAGEQGQAAQPRVLREVFGGLPGRRAAQGLDRRAPEPELSPRRLQSEQLSLHVVDRQAPRLPHAVQGTDITVELLAAPFGPM